MNKELIRNMYILSGLTMIADDLDIECEDVLTASEQIKIMEISNHMDSIFTSEEDQDLARAMLPAIIQEYAKEVIRLGLPQTENES